MVCSKLIICQELQALEAEFDCGRAPVWIARLPLGLDLLVKAFWHGYNRTVMQFFLDVSERSGATHEQQLRRVARCTWSCYAEAKISIVGSRNIGTTAPNNLEAVLNTQSKGRSERAWSIII